MKIGLITTSRADYGIYKPLINKLYNSQSINLTILATGSHLLSRLGNSSSHIENDGYPFVRIPMTLNDDRPIDICMAMSDVIKGFSSYFNDNHFDILIVLGDRYEMFAAVVASVPFTIPIAHIHGGEITAGAIDESLRHSITKMSHLHFPSCEIYKNRILQLGEEPWRVKNVGALSLDNMRNFSPWSREELYKQKEVSIDYDNPPLLVTYHPVTLEIDSLEPYLRSLFFALNQTNKPVIITLPNADTKGMYVRERIINEFGKNCRFQIVETLGTQGYYTVMHYAAAMIGNSSSGMMEAAFFNLPVVNIGLRQAGRMRTSNIIDVPDGDHEQLTKAINTVLTQPDKDKVTINEFGNGYTADAIVDTLTNLPDRKTLLAKRFYELTPTINI